MLESVTVAEAVAGFVVAIGGGGLALNKLGLINFGRKAQCILDKCPDPSCQQAIEQRLDVITVRQDEIKDSQHRTDDKVHKVAENVQFIRGWIEKNGSGGF